MSREVMKLALEAWQTSAYGTVQHHKAMLVAMTEVGKAILAQPVQPEQPASFPMLPERGHGMGYTVDQMKAYARAAIAQPEPVALPDGKRLILVDGTFDELMYWLDRCDSKGHLERCGDLEEPWANFKYEDYALPPQRQPLTEEKQIAEDLRFHGLQLVKTITGYAVLKLGQIAAHNIKEIK